MSTEAPGESLFIIGLGHPCRSSGQLGSLAHGTHVIRVMRLLRILLLSEHQIINAEWTLNFSGLKACLGLVLKSNSSTCNLCPIKHASSKSISSIRIWILCALQRPGISQTAFLLSMRPVPLDLNISREHEAQVVAAA